jgi:ribosome-binding factor A
MQHRDKRVADAIKETVAKIVLNEIADPKVGFVTVTRCHVTRDLRNATVFFSIMGSKEQQREAFAHLEHARSYVRRLVGQRVKLRYLPELRFAIDDVLVQEMRISEIIADMHRDDQPPPTPDAQPDPAD